MSKDVAVKETPILNFPALSQDYKILAEQIRELLGNMTLRDLTQIKVPSAGSLIWTIPTLEGDTTTDTLAGIVVHVQKTRAYYVVSFDESGGGVPPDCSSEDGYTGHGDPWGVCVRCPLNEFGSGPKDSGKACREISRWFLLMENARLPRVLNITPGSIKAAGSYLLRVMDAGLTMDSIVSQIKLVKAVSKGRGIAYSQVSFLQPRAKLTPEQTVAAQTIGRAIKETVKPLLPTPDEVTGA